VKTFIETLLATTRPSIPFGEARVTRAEPDSELTGAGALVQPVHKDTARG